MAYRIAIVEDEPTIRENYADVLKRQGYSVDTYATRQAALEGFRRRLPDLAILDVGLGNDVEGGFELCRELRNLSATVPIIFLSAHDSDFDIISGLRLGADDYLTKDISLPHLSARIAALFRRVEHLAAVPKQEEVLRLGALALDMTRMSVQWQEQPVALTVTELWITHSLVRHPGHVKSRDQLMSDASTVVDNATITSHIKRIRRKFETIDPAFDCIESVHGIGYRWK